MNKYVIFTGGALLGGLLLGAGLVFSDDDRGERGEREHYWEGMRRDVAPAADPRYREECGGCHMAYPPGLLPAASWERLMAGLADHFGDNAELDPETARALTGYLTANAADRAGSLRSSALANSVAGGEPPLRISDTPYFRRKHHEVPPRLVRDNPGVGSFANCQACHRNAEQGSYNEHEVSIPGVGRWDD